MTRGSRSAPSLVVLDDAAVAPLLPTREDGAHKGSHGVLVVVAGSLEYLGAAILSTAAAVRSGTGLVCLATPRSLQPLVAGRIVEAITLGLPEADDGLDPDGAMDALASLGEREPTAFLVGPGLRTDPGTSEVVRRIVAGEGPPAVLDAGALRVLAATDRWWKAAGRPLVLTPHPGELRGLDGGTTPDGDEARLERARDGAARWKQVLVLKGAHTVIAAPDGRASRAPFANPALATAGTGDVLAGVVAGLIAQGVEPYDAACLGVYLHGTAGQNLSERGGEAGLVASDLPHAVASARRHLAVMRDRRASGRQLGFRHEPGGGA